MPSRHLVADRDCASIWFLRLERARNLHDAEGIARAEAKLREMGVRVDWDIPPEPAKLKE